MGGEKEYYVACAADKIYMPDSAALSLRGIAVSGTFLRGVADKVGVSPDIVRIGKFKSAGDQLLRSGMADAQREALGTIADAVYDEFVSTVAASRGLSKEAVTSFLDEGAYAGPRFVEAGIVDGLKYEDQVVEELRSLTGLPAPTPPAWTPLGDRPPKGPEPLRTVALKKYASVSVTAFGLAGKHRVAVLRLSGAIVGGTSPSDSNITAPPSSKFWTRWRPCPKSRRWCWWLIHLVAML